MGVVHRATDHSGAEVVEIRKFERRLVTRLVARLVTMVRVLVDVLDGTSDGLVALQAEALHFLWGSLDLCLCLCDC